MDTGRHTRGSTAENRKVTLEYMQRVNCQFAKLTCSSLGQTVAVCANLGWVGVLFANENIERTASDWNGVLTHVDLMHSILMRHEPHSTMTCRFSSQHATSAIRTVDACIAATAANAPVAAAAADAGGCPTATV